MKPIWIGLAITALACKPATDPALDSAAAFVRHFYAWYVPKADKGTGLEIATGDSAAMFDPALLHALSEDSAAQAKDSTEVVGLDGDPFLNAQDFCQQYEVGAAHLDSGHVLVDVYGICDGKKHAQPDVVAEVAPKGASWYFVDFRYPEEKSTLIKVLADLRDTRARTGKK